MWVSFLISIFYALEASAQTTELQKRILKCEAGLLAKKTCDDPSDELELMKLCLNPVRYVCGKAPPNGQLLTSQCKITINDNENAAQIPEVTGVMDQIKIAEEEFKKNHKDPCDISGPVCKAIDKIKYTHALKQITLDIAYSSAHLAKLNSMFARVKKAALEIIEASTGLAPEAKKIILKKINATELRDPAKDSAPPCYFRHNNQADTGIYNEPYVTADGIPKISICLGSMAMLDRADEASLMIVLGHELSHSIDPCTLDDFAIDNDAPSGKSVYGGLLKCLRGKLLHSNTKENQKAFCTHQQSIQDGMNIKDCQKYIHKVPNCNLSVPNANDSDFDSSHYRDGPGEVNQIQESFSDFFGAQIYAKVLRSESQTHSDSLSGPRKRQILEALGADFASLHGICQFENTNDEHPPGSIRMVNNILGNKEFRQTLCEKVKGKQCSGL